MNSLQFLKSKLQELVDKFPKITIRYDWNGEINTHIVEITPLAEYYNDAGLENEWIKLSLEFIEKFNREEITFISSDSSLSLHKKGLEDILIFKALL